MSLPIDRTAKAAIDTNLVNGVLSDGPKLKASDDVVYNTIDELYNFTTGLISAGTLSKLGVINVKDYNASGLATTAVGSITTGTKVLTLTTTPDFANGQGINLQGAMEASSLQVTAAATVSSNVTVTLNGVAFLIAVLSGDTAIQVATKIRAATYAGWTVGGTAGTDTVTFTSTTSGVKTDAAYSAGTTTATGTMTTTTQGTADQISTVSSVSGLVVNIADNSTRTIAAGSIKHDDNAAFQLAVNQAIALGKDEISVPYGSYNYTTLTSTSGITFIGDGVTLVGATALTLVSIGALSADLALYHPNGVDDTANIQSILNTSGSVKLLSGTYICTMLTLTADMHIYGDGIGRTTIKLKDNTNTSLLYLHNAYESSVTNLKLDGNKANNTVPSTTDDSLILVHNDVGYNNANLYMILHQLTLINGKNNGLYLKVFSNSAFSWVYNTDNIYILGCDGYGFIDETTDNCFSNFYISGCGKADMYIYHAAANKYVNFKFDNGGVTNAGATSQTDGANVIMVNVGFCQFTNFDSQSSYYVGIKMFSCTDIILNAWMADNGLAYAIGDPNSVGTGLAIYDSYNITGDLIFSDNKQRQTTDLFINSTTSHDISFNSKSFNRAKIKNSGLRCYLTSLEELHRLTPIQTIAALTYYVDTVNGSDSNDGLAAGVGHAFLTIMHAVGLIPQIVNHAVNINVAAGTYNEAVFFSGYFGKGSITMTGASVVANAPNFNVNSIEIDNSASIYILITGFNATTLAVAFTASNSNVMFNECSTTSAGTKGYLITRSIAQTYDCTVSNKTVNAVEVTNASSLGSSAWVNSTGNVTGLRSSGGTIMKSGTQPTATTAESTANGGVIR